MYFVVSEIWFIQAMLSKVVVYGGVNEVTDDSLFQFVYSNNLNKFFMQQDV